MLAVLLGAGMLLTETLPVFGTENTEETVRPHQLYCTVLGDSIAKGYTCDKSWMENYGSLAAKEIAYSEGSRYIYHNYARTGLDTAGFIKARCADEFGKSRCYFYNNWFERPAQRM